MQLAALHYQAVGHATRGEQAIELAAALRPDLVLMDINLAGAMDGIAAAQVIMADDVAPQLLGDPTRLRQIIINLVSNAIKFTAKGEVVLSVTIEVSSESAQTLHFAVSDSGVGIAPERLDAIFEAFTQVDSATTRNYGGTGLGLSICAGLVQLVGDLTKQLNARLVIGPGPGAQFIVTFAVETLAAPPKDR